MLIYLSFDKIDTAKSRLRDFNSIQIKIDGIESITTLLHEVQKERDFASLYLLDATLRSQVSFQNQIHETDSIKSYFINVFKKNEMDTTLFENFDILQDYRRQVSWFQLGSETTEFLYNKLIQDFLGQVAVMGAASKIPETRTEINAFISLLWAKEYLGRVRTVLNRTFLVGNFETTSKYGLFATYKGGFESSMQSFQKMAPQEIKDQMKLDFQLKAGKTFEVIDDVFESPDLDKFPYQPDSWWIRATSTIKLLHDLELSSIYRLQAIIAKNVKEEKESINQTVLLLVLSCLAVLLLSAYLISSLTRQLYKMRDAAKDIAEGKIDVQIKKRSNDAIGVLAESFNSISENSKQLALIAKQIGEGNLDVNVPVRGNKDVLGSAIDEMKSSLKEQTDELRKQASELQKQNEEIVASGDALNEKVVELKQANAYKSAFLANMSHELRTPLNSLIILANILSSDDKLNADQKGSIKVILKNAEDLLSLINDILDISKVEAGEMSFNLAHYDFKELLKDLEDLFLPVAGKKNIKWTLDNSVDLSFLKTDRIRFGQILKNLLSNAFKYTKSDGQVILKAYQQGEKVIIEVIDSGIGIPSDKQKTIFEAFKQVDGSISRKYGGTGLGLSISGQICGHLDYDITVSSEESKGSTFSIAIPLANFSNEQEIVLEDVEEEMVQNYIPSSVEEINDFSETEEETDKADWITNDISDNPESFNNREIIILESDIVKVFEISAMLSQFEISVREVEDYNIFAKDLKNSNAVAGIISDENQPLNSMEFQEAMLGLKDKIVFLTPSDVPRVNFEGNVSWLNYPVKLSQLIKELKSE
jgi:signal transduction histidine kinase